jgi:RND family efflux transporter MFP subunit
MKIDQSANSNSPFLRGSCLTLAWILLSMWLVTACGKKEEGPAPAVVRPVKAMTLESQAQALARKFPGRVRAHRRADLSFKVSGRLKELPAEEGAQIKQGQLLARLDPQDLQAQLESARGQLAKAKAALGLAQTEYQRVLNIQKQDAGAVSQSLIDQRREGVDRAQAEIQSLQAAFDAAKLNLSYTELLAPFDGVVSKRYANNFQDVQTKEVILHVDDISVLEVIVDVPEGVMASLRQGVEADIFAEFPTAPGKQYPLVLYEYSTRADPRTQTYQMTLRMDQPEGVNILPGMTATVIGSRKGAATVNNTFIIPAIAVFADESGQAKVWVIGSEDKKVQQRKVTTADLTGSASIQIVAGLKSGEIIAVSGVSQLREGMQVRPVDKIDY